MNILLPSQLQNYSEKGFVLISNLIPKPTVDNARRALQNSVKNTAPGPHHQFLRHRSLLECYTNQVCSAAAQLGGVISSLKRPTITSTMVTFPSDQMWRPSNPHIDHSRKEDGHRTFPPPYTIACIIYLSEVGWHSGGTIVWPGSHRQLETMARMEPEKYRFLWAVNRDIFNVNLGDPIELMPEQGDVLFHHYLCAHAASMNTGSIPRFALNHKW